MGRNPQTPRAFPRQVLKRGRSRRSQKTSTNNPREPRKRKKGTEKTQGIARKIWRNKKFKPIVFAGMDFFLIFVENNQNTITFKMKINIKKYCALMHQDAPGTEIGTVVDKDGELAVVFQDIPSNINVSDLHRYSKSPETDAIKQSLLGIVQATSHRARQKLQSATTPIVEIFNFEYNFHLLEVPLQDIEKIAKIKSIKIKTLPPKGTWMQCW